MDEEPAPQRSSGLTFLLAATAICVSAVGAFVFYERSREAPVAKLDASGFDVAELERRTEAGGGEAVSQGGPQSGLGMIGTISGMKFGQPQAQPGASAAAAPAMSISELVRATEAKIVALAQDYTRRYPVIRQYGQDWMSYPDLRKLNDDYMRDRDPFKFMTGLARSQSFGLIVRKYAAQKPVRDFAVEAMKVAPPEAVSASLEHVQKDNSLKALTDNVAASLGLPPGLLHQMMSGGKVDEKKIAERLGVSAQQAPR